MYTSKQAFHHAQESFLPLS